MYAFLRELRSKRNTFVSIDLMRGFSEKGDHFLCRQFNSNCFFRRITHSHPMIPHVLNTRTNIYDRKKDNYEENKLYEIAPMFFSLFCLF